ncbi:MAG: arylsulfatase [Bacteroidales bacterium]|jgi:arylsulfatase B|nr:arylsulfatase [Bacteroidales bacterium]
MKHTFYFLPVLLPACISAGENRTVHPNIVVILADDLGWANVGYHGSSIQTPHLDQLAQEGLELNRFYTAPISSPTRAGLLTGRYPNRLGIRENVIPPWRDFGIDPAEETLPEMLAEAGYRHRALIGKWHLGHSRKAYYPLSNGYTHFYGHLNGAIDYFTHQREEQLDWHNDWETSYDEGYSTDLITQEAVKCIHQYAKEGPFFLHVAYNAPHDPLQAKPEDIALYTDDLDRLEGKKRKEALYAAMVTCMDRGIGEIRNALQKNGLDENTLILFFSDNGAPANGGGSNLPLKGNKFQEWDGGLRTPALLSFPKRFKGGRRIEQVIGFVDIMPTIRGLLGIRKTPVRPFDGIDVTDILSGKKKNSERDLYLGCGAVVNNNHKFILPGQNGNMKTDAIFLSYYPDDPLEKSNVAGNYPEQVARMKAIAEQFNAILPPATLPPFNEGRKGFVAPFEWKIEKE